jgi:hypothetical protein
MMNPVNHAGSEKGWPPGTVLFGVSGGMGTGLLFAPFVRELPEVRYWVALCDGLVHPTLEALFWLPVPLAILTSLLIVRFSGSRRLKTTVALAGGSAAFSFLSAVLLAGLGYGISTYHVTLAWGYWSLLAWSVCSTVVSIVAIVETSRSQIRGKCPAGAGLHHAGVPRVMGSEAPSAS